MEGLTPGIVFDAITAAGTAVLAVTAIIGSFKVYRRLGVRNETLYGEEALERYEQIKAKLAADGVKKLDVLHFVCGPGTIIPRLEIIKISSDSQILGDEWKGRKAMVRLVTKENGEPMLNRWLL